VVIVRTKARRYETAPLEGNLKRNGGGTKMQDDNLGRSVLFHLASGIMFCMAATVSTASLALDDERPVCTESCLDVVRPDRDIRQTAQARGIAAAQQNRDKECLALVGFAEARGNGSQAMEAVMWVVQNRHVGSKGKTDVCDVIAQRGAFEGVTKPRFQSQFVAIQQGQQLPQVQTRDVVERRALREARQLAAAIVSRERTHDLTRGATHFYAPIAQRQLNRQTPRWTKEYVQTASIGGHTFFRED